MNETKTEHKQAADLLLERVDWGSSEYPRDQSLTARQFAGISGKLKDHDGNALFDTARGGNGGEPGFPERTVQGWCDRQHEDHQLDFGAIKVGGDHRAIETLKPVRGLSKHGKTIGKFFFYEGRRLRLLNTQDDAEHVKAEDPKHPGKPIVLPYGTEVEVRGGWWVATLENWLRAAAVRRKPGRRMGSKVIRKPVPGDPDKGRPGRTLQPEDAGAQERGRSKRAGAAGSAH